MAESRMINTLVAAIIMMLIDGYIVGSSITEQNHSNRAAIPKQCPKTNSPYETIHLPHEWDCTRFYKCDWGKRVEFKCPNADQEGNKLHWNPVKQTCDWPWQAGCISGDPEETTTWVHDTRYNRSHEENCALYYEVINEKEFLRECPIDQHFSPQDHICMNREEAGCKQDPICDVETTTLVHDTRYNRSHEENCDLYYEVINGDKILRKCPIGQHFSPQHHICMNREEAGCKQDPICDVETTTLVHDTRYNRSHEEKCDLYYEVINGDEFLKKCPKDQHFSPQHHICMNREKAGCKQEPVGDVVCRRKCSIFEHGSLIRHEISCNQFYECFDGDLLIRECPVGLHFNPRLRTCDYPSSAAGCISQS